jgi:carbohydrate kinase (thermoresistant glucokinase family)
MGVTGSGKTTLGRALAAELGLPFFDGDDFHPEANREKLRANIPLGDQDRWPWLELLATNMSTWGNAGGAVLACSALKEAYRRVLRSRTRPGAVRFVYIEGSPGQFAERLRERRTQGHELIRAYDAILAGQFRDLEPPREAITVPADWSVERAVKYVAEQVGKPIAKSIAQS